MSEQQASPEEITDAILKAMAIVGSEAISEVALALASERLTEAERLNVIQATVQRYVDRINGLVDLHPDAERLKGIARARASSDFKEMTGQPRFTVIRGGKDEQSSMAQDAAPDGSGPAADAAPASQEGTDVSGQFDPYSGRCD